MQQRISNYWRWKILYRPSLWIWACLTTRAELLSISWYNYFSDSFQNSFYILNCRAKAHFSKSIILFSWLEHCSMYEVEISDSHFNFHDYLYCKNNETTQPWRILTCIHVVGMIFTFCTRNICWVKKSIFLVIVIFWLKNTKC